MKIKKIMLITFLLLAVLTIGAVSAADDTASDNMTVGENDASDNLAVDDSIEEEDSLGAKYNDDHEILVTEDEEITLDENDDEYDSTSVADINLPEDVKGSFRIYNGDEIVARQDFESEDEDATWYYGEDEDAGLLIGSIYASQLDLTKINDGDVLTFKFFELNGEQYSVVDSFTVEYAVTLTDSYMLLTAAGDSGMTAEDVNIKVKDINTTTPDKNFTYLEVTSKDGIFSITMDGVDEEDIIVFQENLKTTQRPYTIVDDGNGNKHYRFGFSFTDINNYLQNSIYQCTFLELIDNELVDGYDIYFNLNEEDETEIDSKTMSFEIENGRILFTDEDEPVDVNYDPELVIIMEDDWQNHDVLTFSVQTGTKGKIVIYLNNDEIPAFEKDISQLTPDEESDSDYKYYTITITDLGITQAGEYIIRDSFVDENGDVIYQYDEEEPEILKLVENQVTPVGNVSIKFPSEEQVIGDDEIFVTISANASADESVKIIIDGKHEFTVKLNETRKDEEENYIIGTEELDLKLAAGQHAINITYKNQNASGFVTLRSNLVIDIAHPSETIYTTFENIYVEFSLDKGEIIQSDDVNGTISVTITDADGNVADTFEVKLKELPNEEDSYVIKADASKKLNGEYTVTVRYFNGNEGETQAQGTVNFKEFKAEDCSAEIMTTVNEKNGYVITLTSVPQSGKIFVEIDGETTVPFDESDVDNQFDEEKGVYYIKFNDLKVSDGTHSIIVYVESADGSPIELATGSVLVDVEQNVDPELSVSVANITEGKTAVINIKTHANITGVVGVKIGNDNYTVNVINGSGSLDVAGLSPGNYTATATFKGNEFFLPSTKNATFTVKAKVATAICAAAVTTTYATSKNIVVTLKDANGNVLAEKEVRVVFNGATKNIKTNAQGQVSLAIGSKLAPKAYPVTFSFAGDDEYLASAGSAKVTVKKAKPKIVAKKKTFKAKKKVKKYTITLKTNKGKAIKKAKVTIKVKGKKYTARTNSKGKATFKLKKLTKKGKYKATVKFAGNKYYIKVTKKVRITVKK